MAHTETRCMHVRHAEMLCHRSHQECASAAGLALLPVLAASMPALPVRIKLQAKESDLQRAQMMMKLKEARLARLQSEPHSWAVEHQASAEHDNAWSSAVGASPQYSTLQLCDCAVCLLLICALQAAAATPLPRWQTCSARSSCCVPRWRRTRRSSALLWRTSSSPRRGHAGGSSLLGSTCTGQEVAATFIDKCVS